MTESTKSSKKTFGQILTDIGKLISTALIIVLFLIGAFLIYYVISAKMSEAEGNVPKFSLYTIVSGSMEPAIKVYDVIFDVRVDDPKTVKVGDIITFISTSSISKDMTVTHRVMDIRVNEGKYEFVTKGDNNLTADSDTAKAENILGRTTFKIPQLGRIQIILATKMGWFMIVLIPALGVVIYDIMKLFKVIIAKGASSQLRANPGDVKDRKRKEEDKMIAETFEKIKRSNLTNSLDDSETSENQ